MRADADAGRGKLTLGSLFDGSGGFPLGALLAGIQPKWASEIEPFPVRVTTKRLPSVKHLGDIHNTRGDEIESVDIITFGSPCTDLSIAGKRAGLSGRQSCLFYEAVRIIKEMRCATNGKSPRFIVWENVTGAFSSSAGRDFQSVLTEIVRIKEPQAPEVPLPEKGAWPYADLLLGDGWSLAYRVLDAQGWGVPQRRRRIYLVADFGGACAGQILFDAESVLGHLAPRFASWQGTAGELASRLGAAGERLSAGFSTEHSAKSYSIGYAEEKSPTLRAGRVPAALFESHGADARYEGPLEVCPTVVRHYGTGGNNQPLVMKDVQAYGISSFQSNAMLSANPKAGIYAADSVRTLDRSGGNPACCQGGTAVVGTVDVRLTSEGTRNARQNVYETNTARSLDTGGNAPDSNQGGVAVVTIQGSAIGRQEKNDPQGSGIAEDVSVTLNTIDRHAVYAMTTGCHTQVECEKSPTLMARDSKDPAVVNQPVYAVRRLTPKECSRLQGFPDGWCENLGTDEPTEEEMAFWRDVFETHRKAMGKAKKPKTDNQIRKWLKNPHSDAAEYKMWGNGVALPCVFYVLSGIAHFATQEA